MEKTVGPHHACVRAVFENTPTPTSEPFDVPADDKGQREAPEGTLDVCGRERRLVVRTRERFAAVQDLLSQGASLEVICRHRQLDRSTVRRYLRKLTPAAPTPAPRPAPRPRRIVRWIMTNPGHLTDEDSLVLKEIRAVCPELDAVTDHVRDFAEMMRDLRGDRLPEWMERVEQDTLPALHSLVNGLRRDQDAVIAGLSTPWSSGQVEGQNTRVELLKRAGYGRANFDLLRKRILCGT